VPRRIAVCADDFGATASITDAIVELADAGRISAVSIMVHGPDVERGALRLGGQRRPGCSRGLHFTLTEAREDAMRIRLPDLALRAWLRLLRPRDLQRMCRRQLDRFEQLTGARPDFVDGHQHVHQFPVVRDVLVRALADRYGGGVMLRSTRPAKYRGVKAGLVAALGARALGRGAERHGLKTNTDFAGGYSFGATGRYRERMRAWLSDVSEGGLIMCHPGKPGDTTDVIAAARHEEYEYLRSAHWLADLAAAEVELSPFASSVTPRLA